MAEASRPDMPMATAVGTTWTKWRFSSTTCAPEPSPRRREPVVLGGIEKMSKSKCNVVEP